MKKIISIICIGISLLFLTSCNDNFLEKYPTDQISEGTFWRTEKDAKMALAGVYNSMMYRSAFNHGRMILDGLTDIGYSSAYPNIGQGIIESTTGSIISSIYSDCYAGISRCNIFLANIDKTEMTAQNIAIAKGEVLFLRAYFYFTLTEFYGGVPLYTKPVTIEEAIVEQSSKDAIVSQVLADLDQAIANLPDQAYTGHAVKGSALALKAQVLMHNQKWAEAATTANQIITSGKFSLYNNYPNLFLAKGQENNPEIIFSIRFLNPDAGINMAGYSPMNPDYITAHAHVLSPLQYYVDAFECTDGLPISQSPLYDPTNVFKNRDPRLAYTCIDFPTYKAKATPLGQTGESWQTAYSCEKYANWASAPWSGASISDQDYILFRYAQVLLMYAECKNESTGPDQSVYNAVNLIRARPGVNMPPLPAGLDKAAMRERIRHERIVELGMEGQRYQDFKRWKIAETVIPTIKDPSGIFRKFDPAKHYLFPFPQSELDRNPKLKQNPGY